jgi:hypothetical protein
VGRDGVDRRSGGKMGTQIHYSLPRQLLGTPALAFIALHCASVTGYIPKHEDTVGLRA